MFKDDDANDDDGAGGQTRYPVMPSLVALQQMRNRLHLAFLGRKLMKWSALATGKELRKLAAEINETFQGYGDNVSAAFIQLARARYFYPNMNSMVLENIGKEAAVLVEIKSKCVTGVKLLELEVIDSGIDPYQHLGIEKGGNAITEAKTTWRDLTKLMILMLQQRISFEILHTAHKNATKKQNVLSKLIIPRIEMSLAYILSELEEQEREETFRLKRFKYSKTKKADKEKDIKENEEKIEVPCKETTDSNEQLIDLKESDVCCANSLLEYDTTDNKESKFICPICKLVAEASDTIKEIKVNLVPCQKCLSEAPSDKERLEHLMSHMSQLLNTDSQCKRKDIDHDKKQDILSSRTIKEKLEHIPTDLPQLIGVFSSKSNDTCLSTQQASETCTCETPHISETSCSCPSLDIILKSSHTSQHSEDSCMCLSSQEPKKSISFNIVNESKETCSCSQGKGEEKIDSASAPCCEQPKQNSSTSCSCPQTPKSKSAYSNNFATYVATVSQVCTPFALRTRKIDFKLNNLSEVCNTGMSIHGVNHLLHSGEQRYGLCYNKNLHPIGSVDTSEILNFFDLEASERVMIEANGLSDCVASNSESGCTNRKQNASNILYRQKHTPFIYYIQEEIPAPYGKLMHNSIRSCDIASHSSFLSYTQRDEPSPCGITISNTITTCNTFDVSCLTLQRKNNFNFNNTNKISCDVMCLEPYTREGKAGPCGLYLEFPKQRSRSHKIRCLPTYIRTGKDRNVAGIISFQANNRTAQSGPCGISELKNAEKNQIKNQLVAYTREGQPGPCGTDYEANSIFPRTLLGASLANVNTIRISFDQNLKQECPALFLVNEFQSIDNHVSSKAISAKTYQGLVNMSSKQSTPYITLSMPPTLSVHYATCQTRLQAPINKATEAYLASRRTQTSLDYTHFLAKTQAKILKAAVPYLPKRPKPYITIPEPSTVSVHCVACEICLQAAEDYLTPKRTHESQYILLDSTKHETVKAIAPYSCRKTYGSSDYASLLPKILASIEKASAAYMKDASKNVCSVKYKQPVPAASGSNMSQPSCCKLLSSPQFKFSQYPSFIRSRTNLNLPSEKFETCNKTASELLQKPDSSTTNIDLGYFETECQEITKVSRLINQDGTFTDKKRVITIKTEKKYPQKLGNIDTIGTDTRINYPLNNISNSSCIKVIPYPSVPKCDKFDYSNITKSNNFNKSRQISLESIDSEQSNTSECSNMLGECDRSTSMSITYINSHLTTRGYAQINKPTLGHSLPHCHSMFQNFKGSQSDFSTCNISTCPKINNYSDRINESYNGADILQNLIYNCTAKTSSCCSTMKKQTSVSTSTTHFNNDNNKSRSVCNIIIPKSSKNCCQKTRDEKINPKTSKKCCDKTRDEIVLKGSDLDTLRKILLPSRSRENSGNKNCNKCELFLRKSDTTESLPCTSCLEKLEHDNEKNHCCTNYGSDHSRPRTPGSSSASKTGISERSHGHCQTKKTSIETKQNSCRDKKAKTCQCSGKCKSCQSKSGKSSSAGQKKCFKDRATSTRLKDRYDVRPAVPGNQNAGGKDKPKRCDCRSVCKCAC